MYHTCICTCMHVCTFTYVPAFLARSDQSRRTISSPLSSLCSVQTPKNINIRGVTLTTIFIFCKYIESGILKNVILILYNKSEINSAIKIEKAQ